MYWISRHLIYPIDQRDSISTHAALAKRFLRAHGFEIMRSHRDVIREAGGVAAFARKVNLQRKPTTVQSWWQRGRIPSEYWLVIVELGLATWIELGVFDAVRREQRRDRTAA